MKAHELARRLLDGPDIPVIHWSGEPPYLSEVDGIWEFPDPTEPWIDEWFPEKGERRSDAAVRLS